MCRCVTLTVFSMWKIYTGNVKEEFFHETFFFCRNISTRNLPIYKIFQHTISNRDKPSQWKLGTLISADGLCKLNVLLSALATSNSIFFKFSTYTKGLWAIFTLECISLKELLECGVDDIFSSLLIYFYGKSYRTHKHFIIDIGAFDTIGVCLDRICCMCVR